MCLCQYQWNNGTKIYHPDATGNSNRRKNRIADGLAIQIDFQSAHAVFYTMA